MRAAVMTAHGGRGVLRVIDGLPLPEPGYGEVRVQMQAVALNRLDLWVRAGWQGLNLTMPHVTCADGAGVVEALGAGVTAFRVGDRVCIDPTYVPPDSPCLDAMGGRENRCDDMAILGEHVPGVAAEYVVLPARNLLKLPDGVGVHEAAAAGLVYLTAWHSLITKGQLQPGETVLSVGAGGGVNTASIQIAKLAGATVYVVGSSAEKCQRARELGADFTINRAENENWSKAVYDMTGRRGVDVVVDNVGQATLQGSIRAVKKGGRILVVGSTSGAKFELDIRYIFSKHITVIGSMMGPHSDYVRVMGLVFDGRLKPPISAVLPMTEIQEAHRMLEAGEVFGKIVLEMG